jgi:hypothetical protein
MSKARLRRGRIFLLGLFLGSQALFCGCTDESKTSGTQVVESPAAGAHRKAKGEGYKGGAPKKQTTGASDKD